MYPIAEYKKEKRRTQGERKKSDINDYARITTTL